MTGAKSRHKSPRSASIWARAAHDLRQPVQAMLLQLPALDRPSSQAERRRAVGQLECALLSLRDMLEMLTLLARVEAGLQDVTSQTVKLEDVLSPLIKRLSDSTRARSVKIPSSGTRALVRSHPALLDLSIKSLMLNAVALGSGGAIAISCRKRGDQILLEIGFNGVPTEVGRDRSAFVLLEAGGSPDGTVGAEPQAGELGLGLDLLEHLCGHLGHALEASGAEGSARTLAIVMPLAKAR